jgi:hypothetical protein
MLSRKILAPLGIGGRPRQNVGHQLAVFLARLACPIVLQVRQQLTVAQLQRSQGVSAGKSCAQAMHVHPKPGGRHHAHGVAGGGQ